ncbi:invasion associated locus B family protein [Thalassococcus lentus]|uniref:Invasion associated locus B family protein n=1 Tax=Thalassococcus lentus TaxID=1210524 RepID=A0ABT4XR41_9RHOB|nr:invasion associated locus B family protein [Thalassococcus lentus]MDA7424370.1 invasion associated locus B family protein [Thalassococcus lentus]
MTKSLILLSLLAALGAAPAMAQQADDTATVDEQAEAPADGGTNIGGPLDLGDEEDAADPAPAAPAGPQTYIKETFGDWALQCLRVPEGQGEDVCQMYQLLKDANGASVAEASIFKLENGGRAVAGGTFVVPLETLLTAKLSVSVDGSKARTYDYSFCAAIGCYARVGFIAEDINRFKAGAVAKVTLVPALAPDQKVTVDMSLTGFTAAFDAVSSLRQ